jgi:hypothetical protein
VRLSSTAKTWGCSPFSITPFAEEVASIPLPNNNNNENVVGAESNKRDCKEINGAKTER